MAKFKQKLINDYNARVNYKMSEAVINRFVNKYKTKGAVKTEHLGG